MEILIWQQRTAKGISLTELADKTGVSKSALNNYETGKRFPRIDQLETIAKVLNIRISDLVDSDYI